jgi:hypothetical protein
VSVRVDTSEADRMFERLAANASRARLAAVDVARASRVTGIPVDTGRLAASPRVVETDNGAEIVTDVPYARFVFGGTRFMPASPPHVEGPDLAATVAKELFT